MCGFRILNLWVSKLTGRGDGGFVGAQASGLARARRQTAEFFSVAFFYLKLALAELNNHAYTVYTYSIKLTTIVFPHGFALLSSSL